MTMPYHDLHEHIALLEKNGLLHRISRPVNKNTELHPLVRLQFRGLEESERKAFLFENVTDGRGTSYPFPVLAGGLAPSQQIYALGMQCAVEEINSRWTRAMEQPIEPVEVTTARCQEVVHTLDPSGIPGTGLDAFPIPVSTPGWDPAPFLTCAHWVSHDPVTGKRNIGNYRGHVKAPNRVGLTLLTPTQGIGPHWQAARKLGKPLEVAIVVGAPPLVTYASASKVPPGADELAVAGGIAGEPIRTVRCKTVDVYVPADAEIVIEGRVSIDEMEPEGPFGEFIGYIQPTKYARFMDIHCITHRKDAVFASLVSQISPSESSVMRRLSTEPVYLRHLRGAMGIGSLKGVHLYEELLSVRRLAVLQFEKPHSDQVKRALLATASLVAGGAKVIIAVDHDIDHTDLTSVMWAVGTRCTPHKDVTIIPGFRLGTVPPFADFDEHGFVSHEEGQNDSVMLINATMDTPYPPVSLPKKQYMDRAVALWQELGLPELRLRNPWYGVSLGQWSDTLEAAARAAAEGDYRTYGDALKRMRKPVSGI
jgi:4-hydroxy-3-polyprenylbenzoate decarboxylase